MHRILYFECICTQQNWSFEPDVTVESDCLVAALCRKSILHFINSTRSDSLRISRLGDFAGEWRMVECDSEKGTSYQAPYELSRTEVVDAQAQHLLLSLLLNFSTELKKCLINNFENYGMWDRVKDMRLGSSEMQQRFDFLVIILLGEECDSDSHNLSVTSSASSGPASTIADFKAVYNIANDKILLYFMFKFSDPKGRINN